ncbi:FAD:protein FMN transferase [Mucilaginibacter puniceus]
MGDNFEISVVGNDPVWANQHIDTALNEISRVEKLLSTFSDDSIINQINRNAGIAPVKVSTEIFNMFSRALQISELTYGVFDITYASVEKDLYTRDSGLLTKDVYCINYKDIILDAAKTTVFLNKKNMRVGFGAVSKGYAADRAKYALQMAGVSSGVINAGGDLLTWGLQPDFTAWTVAVADPEQEGKPYGHINISDMAIATSVNTEKYVAINPVVSNTIDPKSGFIVSDIASVSILGPTAEFADAMATPVMAIGINGGLYLVNQLNQIGCIIVDDHNRVYTSRDILITE